jgi:hypothetical protein
MRRWQNARLQIGKAEGKAFATAGKIFCTFSAHIGNAEQMPLQFKAAFNSQKWLENHANPMRLQCVANVKYLA